jgi:hypothetical protein
MFGGITYCSVLMEAFEHSSNVRKNIRTFCGTIFEIWVSLRAETQIRSFRVPVRRVRCAPHFKGFLSVACDSVCTGWLRVKS